MLLVIMTRSLIRLDNTVRASIDDERQWNDNDDRTDDNTGITKDYNEWDWEDDAMTETDISITRGYKRYNEKLWERKKRSWSNRFRLIRKSVIRRMKRIRKNTSRTSLFSITISTLISTFISTKLTLISTINLNLTLFEPHSTPPSHSPRNPHSPLSSPYPLSPHSIPLVTSNFTSITFCYGSKSPWTISVSAPFTLVIPTSSCFTRWVVSGSG